MNPEKFTEVMNEIDDRFYEEAANYKAKPKMQRWKKWTAVAATVAVVILTGTVTLAQNKDLVNRIAEILPDFSKKPEEPYLEWKKEMWLPYMEPLNDVIELPNAKLYLDGILYDSYYIMIAYHYLPTDHSLESGTVAEEFEMYKIGCKLDKVLFRVQRHQEIRNEQYPDSEFRDMWRRANCTYSWIVREDGSIGGCFFLTRPDEFSESANDYSFRQNDVLECSYDRGEILYKRVLDREIGEIEIATNILKYPEGIVTEKMIVTPLSLHLYCQLASQSETEQKEFDQRTGKLKKEVEVLEVVLSDGSTVQGIGTSGAWGMQTPRMQKNYRLERQIDLSEVMGIRLTTGEFFPVEQGR